MKRLAFPIFIIVVLFNVIMAYYSTTTCADYHVELIEKVQIKCKHWAKFYDPFSEGYIDVIVGEEVYGQLEHGEIYVITYGYNQLFKNPVLEKTELSDLEY